MDIGCGINSFVLDVRIFVQVICMTATIKKSIEEVVNEDGRYPVEAFGFLHEALGHAVKQVHGKEEGSAGVEGSFSRHVTGEQLCWAVRDLAITRYGLLARNVLDRWNIRSTEDFGHMVYLLVDKGFMKKKASDSIEDFRKVYSFETAFEADLDPELI